MENNGFGRRRAPAHRSDRLVFDSALSAASIRLRRDLELLGNGIIPIERSFEEHSRPGIDNMRRLCGDFTRLFDGA